MVEVYIICEGQTEVQFVKYVLAPQLALSSIFVHGVQLGRVGHKGGNVTLERVAVDIRNILNQRAKVFCSTFIDFYGLPSDFPGKAEAIRMTSIEAKSHIIHTKLKEALQGELGTEQLYRFIPYVQMYEFEALLFSHPLILAEKTVPSRLNDFTKIRGGFATPEEINDSPDTAPSKRIKKLFPNYNKPIGGRKIAEAIGLDQIRAECRLFDQWLTQLENLIP